MKSRPEEAGILEEKAEERVEEEENQERKEERDRTAIANKPRQAKKKSK